MIRNIAFRRNVSYIKRLKEMMKIVRHPIMFSTIICVPQLVELIHIWTLGQFTVGFCGMIGFLIHQVSLVRMGHGAAVALNIMMFIGWLSALSNDALARLTIFIGSGIVMQRVFMYLKIRARTLAMTLSDIVLEPSRDF